MAEEELRLRVVLEGEERIGTLKGSLKDLGERARETQARFTRLRGYMSDLSRVFMQASIAVFIFGMMQRRVRTETWAVQDAEEAYAKAVRKSGATSEEALEALKRLERARIKLREAVQQNILATGTWLLNLGALTVQTWASVKARLASAAATAASTSATTISTAATKAHTKAVEENALANLALNAKEMALLSTRKTGAFVNLMAMATIAEKTAAEATGAAVTGVADAADKAHTATIWAKVFSLQALKNALIGVKLAGIPLVGWLAGAVIGGAALGYGVIGPMLRRGPVPAPYGREEAYPTPTPAPAPTTTETTVKKEININVDKIEVAAKGRSPEALMREFYLAAKSSEVSMW